MHHVTTSRRVRSVFERCARIIYTTSLVQRKRSQMSGQPSNIVLVGSRHVQAKNEDASASQSRGTRLTSIFGPPSSPPPTSSPYAVFLYTLFQVIRSSIIAVEKWLSCRIFSHFLLWSRCNTSGTSRGDRELVARPLTGRQHVRRSCMGTEDQRVVGRSISFRLPEPSSVCSRYLHFSAKIFE